MGWLIKRQSTEAQEAIRVSFEHVKNDVSNLQSWIHHINKTNSYQQQVIDHLRGQIVHLQQAKQEAFQLTRREIRDLIDAHYSLEPVMERINKLENQLEGMKHQDSAPTTDLSPVLAKLNEIAGKISKPVERPQIIQKPSTSHLQQKVVRDVARRSKEYVKNVIYNLASAVGAGNTLGSARFMRRNHPLLA